MKKILLFASTVFCGLLLVSCSKSDSMTASPNNNNNGSNNGGTQAKMGYTLSASNTSAGLAQKASASGTIQWTSGFASPTLIKFEATQNGAQLEFKSTNTAQVNLFAPVATVFGNFTLPSGTYNEVELKVQLNPNSGSPAMQLDGTFTSSSVTIPVSFVVNEGVEIKTEASNITIDSTTFNASTTLDLSSFTTGVTQAMLAGAQVSSGTIVISKSSNKDIYNIILNNLTNKRHHCEVEHSH